MSDLPNPDELTETDPRSKFFAIPDPDADDGYRRISLEDRHQQVVELSFSDPVPEDVKSSFAVARSIWLYGWFHWPLHTAASLHAYTTLEMALQEACKREGFFKEEIKSEEGPGLKRLLEKAVAEKWIVDRKLRWARGLGIYDLDEDTVEAFKSGDLKHIDPIPIDAQEYAKRLTDVLPKLRNRAAHPQGYSHLTPNYGLQSLELVYDVVEQLF